MIKNKLFGIFSLRSCLFCLDLKNGIFIINIYCLISMIYFTLKILFIDIMESHSIETFLYYKNFIDIFWDILNFYAFYLGEVTRNNSQNIKHLEYFLKFWKFNFFLQFFYETTKIIFLFQRKNNEDHFFETYFRILYIIFLLYILIVIQSWCFQNYKDNYNISENYDDNYYYNNNKSYYNDNLRNNNNQRLIPNDYEMLNLQNIDQNNIKYNVKTLNKEGSYIAPPAVDNS